MARLRSQAQKGYYKTPPHLIPLMAKHLRVIGNPENARILDPCAGKGEALDLLGEALGLDRKQLYANELDEERFKDCQALGINAVCGDAIDELRVSPRTFGLLYLNPPYDDEGNLEGRTEAKFLKSTFQYLCQNGTLIYVVPESVLAKQEVAKVLPIMLKDVTVFRFPEEDYKPFKQVVLIGRKMRGESRMFIDQYNAALASPITLGDDGPTYIVPETGKLNLNFYSHNLTPDQLGQFVSMNTADKFMREGLTAGVETKVSTLMPLRSGHQALMLASGMMDGAYEDPSTGNTWVISGKTEMVKTKSFESHDSGVEVRKVRHTPTPVVKVLDLTASMEKSEIVLYDLK